MKLAVVLPYLNEKQRRILAAAEAKSLGRGGIQRISNMTGLSRPTLYRGLKDIEATEAQAATDVNRVRQPGGGRKSLAEHRPEILDAIEGLMDPSVRGDPESPLRWTCKSVRTLEFELNRMGYKISYPSIAMILHGLDYSLQANRKTSEGEDHPDRNQQFEYISRQAKIFLKKGAPVISVDTKKKELIGNFKNGGKEWERKGEPLKVMGHDFPDPKIKKAVPYGVYDIGDNKGWVNVGVDADTAEFAVESIRQWWRRMGKKRYPKARELLICADSGGSNGYRSHLWKRELYCWAKKEKLSISVCHFPPGTSKWNKIEHRLFSYITMNWRGHPLTSYQAIVNLISATKTKTGLKIRARLDRRKYERGIKVTKQELNEIKIKRHAFHGEWNYTIL